MRNNRSLLLFFGFNAIALKLIFYLDSLLKKRLQTRPQSLPHLNYNELFKDVSLPAAFVDLDAFEANLKTLIQRSQGKPLRVATKSIRCVELLRRAGGSSVMTFSAKETLFLAR
jgi:hypothetical protein